MTDRRDDVLFMVDAYLHGLLDGEDRRYVAGKTSSDEVWAAALRQARRRDEALRRLPQVEASQDLIDATIHRVQSREEHRTRRKRRLVWSAGGLIAAAVAVMALANLYYYHLEPTPYDLRVMGQASLIADSDASLRIVLSRHSYDRDWTEQYEPIEDTRVSIDLMGRGGEKAIRLASFTTDQTGSGSPRFRLPDWAQGEYQLRVIADTPGRNETFTRTVKLVRSWRLMLSTDKPVYQPGQTIHARALAMRSTDRKPIAGQTALFTVTDPRGNVIFKHEALTSAYGITSTDCPLADEILHGNYTLRCVVGDTESSVTVEVRPYVLPKFKLAVELDKPYYAPGETIRGTVRADYFFGRPVAGGEVSVSATVPGPAGRQLQAPAARTDENGEAGFELRLPEKLFDAEQHDGDAQLELEIEATDSAGQRERSHVSCTVTNRPLRVRVLPEGGSLVRGVPNTIYFIATYADGRPARVDLTVSGFDESVQTSTLGVASLVMTPNEDTVKLHYRATDDAGMIDDRSIDLRAGEAGDDFLIQTDRAVYRGGQTMNLHVFGGGGEPVFIDLIKDGQTLLTETVDMKQGRGAYAFDLPPDAAGTIQVVGYRFGASGLPLRRARAVYVEPAGELHVALAYDAEVYRPGESAKLTLTLRDEQGKPAQGAVSVAAVDEAVFAVQPQRPGSEQTFFTLEQELLEPIYAIYSWSPDWLRDAPDQDRRQLEQAIFSATAGQPQTQRDTIFRRLVNEGYLGPEYLEDAFSSPYFEQSLSRMEETGQISPEIAAVIKDGHDGTHTLQARTYPVKEASTYDARRKALEGFKAAWAILGAITITALFMLGFAMAFRTHWALAFLLSSLAVFIIALMLPALGAARRTARQMTSMTAVRGLAQSLEMMNVRDPFASPTAESADAAPRVRQWFPETLYWRPQLISDDAGRVEVEIPLADSITTWRLSASAVDAAGRLGGLAAPLPVFQPFFVDLNLPVALTRGDEVGVPIVVYNYLDQPQDVRLEAAPGDWFEPMGPTTMTLRLQPHDVRSVHLPIRVTRVGTHEMEVRAFGGQTSDAIRRSIEVRPDGRRIEHVVNGTLAEPAEIELSIPENAIEGSVVATLRLLPSSFSQVAEGLDAVFQRPYGCFEQTSSTTYPNVLALAYLRLTKTNAPQVEAKAREYIHLGYQRLLSFEVAGGGFDWFGHPPANRTLTAYGLMEFEDMARVHDVDPDLIARTRRWLLGQRRADGAWDVEGHAMHDDPAQSSHARLATTAYIAWAVYRHDNSDTGSTFSYLTSFDPNMVDDPYVLALMANALLAIDPDGAAPYLNALERRAVRSDDGKLAWWRQLPGAQTRFYGGGLSGDIETTATTALAFIEAKRRPDLVRGALSWLIEQKDASGTWHSTQATVLALKALLAGTGSPLGGDHERVVELLLDDKALDTIRIAADQAEVVRQIDLTPYITLGTRRLHLHERSDDPCGYQVVLRYHTPHKDTAAVAEPLSIEVSYHRAELNVNDELRARATVTNHQAVDAPMVILDLPVPAGFTIEDAELRQLAARGVIAKYQVTPRSVVVYLRRLTPGQRTALDYGLRATMPVKVQTEAPRAYEYYNPDVSATGASYSLHIRGET